MTKSKVTLHQNLIRVVKGFLPALDRALNGVVAAWERWLEDQVEP
jgi:hypothetical protein